LANPDKRRLPKTGSALQQIYPQSEKQQNRIEQKGSGRPGAKQSPNF